ncbi:MAG: ABC transporter substrate-binding protein [Methanomassiliicoccales archaeon]|nr:ABC transporter substrate-binding protein [Methanomassiliicoccales archaeon]
MLMVIALLSIALPLTTEGVNGADATVISITDSRGVTTNLSQPSTHVASFGAFATNTLVDIGSLEKAVIFDSYSEYNKSGIPEMMGIPADKFITVSSSNKDAVVQTMLDLVDADAWNLTTDVIFGYGYSSYSPMWSELEGYGFHVITFYPNSYDGIVHVVEDIESVVGADHNVSQQMTFVKAYIAATLSEEGIDEEDEFVTALYASYSGGNLKLGNSGSVTVDFIEYAGGVNVAEDPNKSVPTYAVDFSAIVQLSPEVVLLDGYFIGTTEDFSALIGDDDIIVYKLNKSWNSYCPDATVGLWTIACLFYPNIFEGDVPVEGEMEDIEISITDSRGVTTNLSQPATHVASFGAFATNTLVDIGLLGSAVIFDATSEYNRSGIPEMMGVSESKFVTVSGSNKDQVVQRMLDLVDEEVWNKSGDVILGFGYSYLNVVWDELEGYGFKVITFYPDSYDGIVQVVRDIETVTGANHSVSNHMVFVKEYIADTLADEGVIDPENKVRALYVSYSGDVMYLGNKGSVTVDFITFAGGVNVAHDETNENNRYSTDFTAILLLEPEIVLLDGYYPGTAQEFLDQVNNDDIIVYKLNKSWNSYCPDATEGLWAVACLFYPDYFEGNLPVEGTTGDEGSDLTMVYAIVGVVIIVLAIAMVLLMRRKDRKD